MPLDPEPGPGGTVRLTQAGAAVLPLGVVLSAMLAFGHTDLYGAHFVTCPYAALHRGRKRRQPAHRR